MPPATPLTALLVAAVAIVAGVPLSRVADRSVQGEGRVSAVARVGTIAALAVALGVLVLRFGPGPALLPFAGLAVLGVPLALVDIAEHRLPNGLVLLTGGVVGALLLVATLLEGDLLRMVGVVIGGVGLFVLYLVLALAARGQIGMGDVKLAAVLGAVLAFAGWRVWVYGVLAGFVLNGLVALVAVVTHRSLRGAVPFGPSMLAGALLAVVLL